MKDPNGQYKLLFSDHDWSFWPEGPYALPMSTDECPESQTSGWLTGYINITTKEPVNILMTQRNINHDDQTTSEVYKDTIIDYNSNVNTIGPFGDRTLQLNFCYKVKDHFSNRLHRWPDGDYSIYGDTSICPEGIYSISNKVIFTIFLSSTVKYIFCNFKYLKDLEYLLL